MDAADVEITPEMINAGMKALREAFAAKCVDELTVVDIFYGMLAALHSGSDDPAGVRWRLGAQIRQAGSQRKWAAQHAISPQYVNDVLKGRREAGPAICNALGLHKRVIYYAVPFAAHNKG